MINSFDDYEMFTDEGNAAVTSLVDQVSAALMEGISREGAVELLKAGLVEIATQHGEAHDTAVEESICRTLSPEFDDMGYAELQRGEF